MVAGEGHHRHAGPELAGSGVAGATGATGAGPAGLAGQWENGGGPLLVLPRPAGLHEARVNGEFAQRGEDVVLAAPQPPQPVEGHHLDPRLTPLGEVQAGVRAMDRRHGHERGHRCRNEVRIRGGVRPETQRSALFTAETMALKEEVVMDGSMPTPHSTWPFTSAST